MWIVLSVLCMVFLTFADIVGKKAVGSDELAPIKLRILAMIASIAIGILFYLFGLSESGIAPWILAVKYPFILFAVVFLVASEFLYIYSLKYIGLSIMEAVSGIEGVFIFIGLIVINAVTGKLEAVKEMLNPIRLILILIILITTWILPNIELLSSKKIPKTNEKIKEKNKIAVGIIISLFAVILGSCDSLINDAILGSETLGPIDYIMTGYFSFIFVLPFFFVALFVKSKNVKSKYNVVNRYSVLYAVFYVLQIFTGLYATSIDAVRSEIIYLTYPVISILGAKIILKEKYSLKQNICIWLITFTAIAFCVIDYFM